MKYEWAPWSAATDCNREGSPCRGWSRDAQDGCPESKARGRRLAKRTLGCMQGGGPSEGQASAVRNQARPRRDPFHASGADHEDAAEPLTESPFPVSRKCHPSNAGRQSGETAGLRAQVKRKVGKIPGAKTGQLGGRAEGDRPRPQTLQAPLQSRRASAQQLVGPPLQGASLDSPPSAF